METLKNSGEKFHMNFKIFSRGKIHSKSLAEGILILDNPVSSCAIQSIPPPLPRPGIDWIWQYVLVHFPLRRTPRSIYMQPAALSFLFSLAFPSRWRTHERPRVQPVPCRSRWVGGCMGGGSHSIFSRRERRGERKLTRRERWKGMGEECVLL